MLPPHDSDCIETDFDDHWLVTDAGSSCRSFWPIIWDRADCWTITLTCEMRQVGPMRETSC